MATFRSHWALAQVECHVPFAWSVPRRGSPQETGRYRKATGVYLHQGERAGHTVPQTASIKAHLYGNRERATIKAIPATLHHPRPYGNGGTSGKRCGRRGIDLSSRSVAMVMQSIFGSRCASCCAF